MVLILISIMCNAQKNYALLEKEAYGYSVSGKIENTKVGIGSHISSKIRVPILLDL